MFDLLALAFQTDLTRVSTFLLSREANVRTFPEIGVSDAWHTPLAKLHRTLLAKLGVPVESIGDSTGHLPVDLLSAA